MDIGETTHSYEFEPLETEQPAPVEPATPEPAHIEPEPAREPVPA